MALPSIMSFRRGALGTAPPIKPTFNRFLLRGVCAGWHAFLPIGFASDTWAARHRWAALLSLVRRRFSRRRRHQAHSDSIPKAVVLLSGGLDSMVCAARAREAGFQVLA